MDSFEQATMRRNAEQTDRKARDRSASVMPCHERRRSGDERRRRKGLARRGDTRREHEATRPRDEEQRFGREAQPEGMTRGGSRSNADDRALLRRERKQPRTDEAGCRRGDNYHATFMNRSRAFLSP